MSIYIKGMEVPKTCWECIDKYHLVHDVKCTIYDKLYRYRYRLMNINDPILREKRAEGCPLIEVHRPHGDLLDRNDLLDEINLMYPINSPEYSAVFDMISDMDAVIERE